MHADALAEENYLPSMTLDSYLRNVVPTHPLLNSVLDFERPDADEALKRLFATTTEFDSDFTGRGDSYRRAQRDASVRWTGARQLLQLAAPTDGAEGTVLDVLGGDGLIARALSGHPEGAEVNLSILTGDLSGEMVGQALAHGLPAVRQAADHLFLRDNTMDAVLLAYGTHHIAPQERLCAITEALRVTRPGGRVVLHDFDEHSPMAYFFSDIVHPNTAAGHDYVHFSRELLAGLFDQAGTPARVIDMYDPLIVAGYTEDDARQRMCEYVADMYGVRSVFDALEGPEARWRLLEHCFGHEKYLASLPGEANFTSQPVVYRANGLFVAEVPRVAIVALAQKAG